MPSTRNNVEQAWRTRTLLEELRRESREVMWQRLAQSRPMPGVPLPRPCDPRPGHFIDQMLAKAHALWRENVKQAVGYDSRFLLPAGDKVLALPAPEVKPVEAIAKTVIIPFPVASRKAVIYLPACLDGQRWEKAA